MSNWTPVLFAGVALAIGSLTTSAVHAQEGDHEVLDLRAISVHPGGEIRVDRGADIGMASGDRVRFLPVAGGSYAGAVTIVEDRSATVQLDDERVEIAPGTRGEVWIPRTRLATEGEASGGDESEPTEPRFQNEDGGWEQGMPLLADVEGVRPEARPERMSGRVYTIMDQRFTDDSDRSDSFYRLGGELEIENPYGRGGAIHLDGELNVRSTDTPDDEDDSSELRIDRASYRRGGDRFSPDGFEAGRFLQRDVAEFGVLDGFQYTRRFGNGARAGASVGFMPEPDREYDTGEDFQLSAYYRWVADPTERVAVTGGYQKSLHNGSSDRELVLLKGHALGLDGWDLHGSSWIDVYDNDERVKSSGIELTQAFAMASKTWETGNGVSFRYNRLRYPELLRDEFLQPPLDVLEDGGYDRLSMQGWRTIAEKRRFRATLGAWDGQDDSGGDLELAIEQEDALRPGGRLTGALFTVKGQFSDVVGLRVGYAESIGRGFWDVAYEYTKVDEVGFDLDNDDLTQHRVRGSHRLPIGNDWDLATSAESVLDDELVSFNFGVYLQWSF